MTESKAPNVDTSASTVLGSAIEKRTYIPGLDGVRAIAFVLVYVAHAGLDFLVPGGLGVTIFFFLSGYLITTLLRIESARTGTISIRQFYLRRTFRIFPPMYVTIIFWMLLAATGVLIGSIEWQPIVLASVYLTNYTNIFTLHRIQGGLNILWSLSVEEHFYLLFPWLFLLFIKRGWSTARRSVLLGGLCCLALVWRYVLMTRFHATYNYEHTDTRFDSILFGCLFAVRLNPFLDKMPRWINKYSAAIARSGVGLLVLCLLIRTQLFRDTLRYTLQGIAIGAIFLYILNSPNGWLVRNLENPFLRLIGRRSYAMYLIHYCVIQTIERKVGMHTAIVLILGAPLIYGYAWAMSRFIERPAERIKKSFYPRMSTITLSPAQPGVLGLQGGD